MLISCFAAEFSFNANFLPFVSPWHNTGVPIVRIKDLFLADGAIILVALTTWLGTIFSACFRKIWRWMEVCSRVFLSSSIPTVSCYDLYCQENEKYFRGIFSNPDDEFPVKFALTYKNWRLNEGRNQGYRWSVTPAIITSSLVLLILLSLHTAQCKGYFNFQANLRPDNAPPSQL